MRSVWLAAVLIAFGHWAALACDEECATGFVFDDAQGTCVRVGTS
jgi:hypothetical protein